MPPPYNTRSAGKVDGNSKRTLPSPEPLIFHGVRPATPSDTDSDLSAHSDDADNLPSPDMDAALKDIQTQLDMMSFSDKAHIPKIDFFHGFANEDAKLWWQRFQQVATFNKWDGPKMGDAFLLYLRGPAETWANQDAIKDILGKTEELKTAFLTKFQHQATTFLLQTQFVERRMQPTETVEQFLTALQDIAQKLGKEEKEVLGQ